MVTGLYGTIIMVALSACALRWAIDIVIDQKDTLCRVIDIGFGKARDTPPWEDSWRIVLNITAPAYPNIPPAVFLAYQNITAAVVEEVREHFVMSDEAKHECRVSPAANAIRHLRYVKAEPHTIEGSVALAFLATFFFIYSLMCAWLVFVDFYNSKKASAIAVLKETSEKEKKKD